MIRLLYFASVRERLGVESEELALPAGVDNLDALLAHLAGRGDAWRQVLEDDALLAAINQTMARRSAALQDGDEVALFPPVTGG